MPATSRLADDPWSEPIGVFPKSVETWGTAMVTGHRPQGLTASEVAWSKVALAHTVWRLRSRYGTTTAISGMALGADVWWAIAAVSAGMRLHAFIPFEGQADAWPEEDRLLWSEVRRKAIAETLVVPGAGLDRLTIVKALHARNDAMLTATATASGLVVALFKPGAAGGTASAVDKARKKGLPLLMLNPEARQIRREGW